MKKIIFCVVMVMMTITTINVWAQPGLPLSSNFEEPIIINKSPKRFVSFELDSNDRRDVRINSLRIQILRTLDSIYEKNNYRLVNKIKYYQTPGGEFSVRELYKGNFEFSGTCSCDTYRFDLRNVFWDRLGKKFQLKFGTVFYGDKDVNVNIVEIRFKEFLQRIRTPEINK